MSAYRQTECAARPDAHQGDQCRLGDDRVEKAFGRRWAGHIVVPGRKVQRGQDDLVQGGGRGPRRVGLQRAKVTRRLGVHVPGLRPERRGGVRLFGQRAGHRQVPIP